MINASTKSARVTNIMIIIIIIIKQKLSITRVRYLSPIRQRWTHGGSHKGSVLKSEEGGCGGYGLDVNEQHRLVNI